MQAVYTRPMKAKLDELKITYRIVWEPGAGDEVRERVEAVKRWFVHDWQTLDNKVKSSIVEGVSVFLAMFDMPDVAKVFCPDAPEVPDDPQAITVQAQLRRIAVVKAEAPGGPEDDKPEIKDGGAERNRAVTFIPSAKEETVKGAEHLPPLYELIEGGQGAGLEHARRDQPGAGPRRGRHAQERLAPGASHASGQDEAVAGRLLPARRLYL